MKTVELRPVETGAIEAFLRKAGLIAVGWNAGQLKVGSFARSERMAKWNECLRIEETLGRDAVFAGRDALAFLKGRS